MTASIRDEHAEAERQLGTLTGELATQFGIPGQVASFLARIIHETANAAFNQGQTAAASHEDRASDQIYASVRRVAVENPDLFPALAMFQRSVDAAAAACGKYSRPHRIGGILGPCTKNHAHDGWHLDATGAAWDPAMDADQPAVAR